MNREEIIGYYIEKSLNEGFEIDQIRKELQAKNLDEMDIKFIIRQVDQAIQSWALMKTSIQKSNEIIIIGGILTLIGLGITIGTYSGFINLGNSFLIVYGPFLGGISLLIFGFKQRRNPNIRSQIRTKKPWDNR